MAPVEEEEHDDRTLPPRILLQMQSKQNIPLHMLTLLDIETNKNLMSHRTWQKLGKTELTSTNMMLLMSPSQLGVCIGSFNKSFIANSNLGEAKFFIMA